MILDTLEHLNAYRGIHQNLDLAIDYLQGHDICSLDAGRYEVRGDTVFFMRQDAALRAAEDARYEAHRRYADIQIAYTPGEAIAWLPVSAIPVWQPFNEASDIGFSESRPEGTVIPLTPGTFMLFFPQDAHMPCLRTGEADTVRKVCVKILLED